MIGARVGAAVGARLGAAVGVLDDEWSPGGGPALAGVAQDATSLKYRPATAGQWTTTLAAAGLSGGNPGGLWLCQEASGNLADSIGANPLVVAGTPTFHGANPGWSTFSVNITATTVQAFTLGTGPFDASAGSVAWLWYGCSTATGAGRMMVAPSGSATGLQIVHLATDKLQIKLAAGTATTINTYTGTALFPMLLVYNKTASSCTLYTALEALSVTFAAVVDGSKGLGAVGALTGDPTTHTNYIAAFSGAAAEQFTTAGARALLSTLAWSPAF